MKDFLDPSDIGTLTAYELETICRRSTQFVSLAPNEGLARVLSRFKMFVDATDMSVAPHLILDGFWETWLTQSIAQQVKQGDYCIDIGANFGYYSLLLSILTNTPNRVIAIEPNPTVHTLLAKTAEMNFPGFETQNVAVGDRVGEQLLYIPEGKLGDASLLDRWQNEDSNVYKIAVPLTTVDEIVQKKGWPRVDIIKIDAEGAEPNIVNGMRRTISNNKDLKIYLEFSPHLYTDPQGFIDHLMTTHYIYRVHSNGCQLVPNDEINLLVARDVHQDLLLVREPLEQLTNL